jgi:hypothetical protein
MNLVLKLQANDIKINPKLIRSAIASRQNMVF